MTHARAQIREAIATRLSGLTTTGTRVFQSRLRPLADADLPCLLVFCIQEDLDYSGLDYPRRQRRQVQIEIKAVVKQTASLDDELDGIAAEIEFALAGSLTAVTLGGLLKELALGRTAIDFDAGLEKPVGIATLTYVGTYLTLENAPGVLL